MTATKNKISIAENEIPLIIIQHGRIINGATLQYGSYMLELPNSIPKLQTTNVAAIYAKDLLPAVILIPSFSEQQRIAEEIEHCFSAADAIERTIEQSLKKSEKLRQSILKRAFEGKIVPQNESDESAEKLLERIRAERVKNRQGGLL